MNFEKISFRTTADEKAFLESLNQRFKCRTMTALMHKLLADYMNKINAVPTSNPVVSDSILGANDEAALRLADTRAEIAVPVMAMPTGQSFLQHTKEYNPALELIEYIEDLEKLGKVINRALYSRD